MSSSPLDPRCVPDTEPPEEESSPEREAHDSVRSFIPLSRTRPTEVKTRHFDWTHPSMPVEGEDASEYAHSDWVDGAAHGEAVVHDEDVRADDAVPGLHVEHGREVVQVRRERREERAHGVAAARVVLGADGDGQHGDPCTAEEGKTGVPDSAYFAAHESARGVGDAFLAYAAEQGAEAAGHRMRSRHPEPETEMILLVYV